MSWQQRKLLVRQNHDSALTCSSHQKGKKKQSKIYIFQLFCKNTWWIMNNLINFIFKHSRFCFPTNVKCWVLHAGQHGEGQHRQEVLRSLRRRGGWAEVQHSWFVSLRSFSIFMEEAQLLWSPSVCLFLRFGDAQWHESQAGSAGEGEGETAG